MKAPLQATLLSKLPSYYLQNSLFRQFSEDIDRSQVMSSLLLYSKEGKNYLINKDGIMHAPLDWQLFSMMRTSSKLIVTSGSIVRAEDGLFMKRQSYGDSQVEELYRSVLGNQKQDLMVLSRIMNRAQLLPLINPNLYRLIDCPVVRQKTQFVQELASYKEKPIIIELGLSFLHPYYEEVLAGGKNMIDLIMISRFEGDLDPKYIGNEFNLPLKQLYKKTWQSQRYPCTLPDNVQGTLTFETYSF